LFLFRDEVSKKWVDGAGDFEGFRGTASSQGQGSSENVSSAAHENLHVF